MLWQVFSKAEKTIGSLLAILLALVLVSWIVSEFRHASWTAEQSALAALDKEISDQLSAIPAGQKYPESLSELSLTYPDGGDRSLLSRFHYSSTGESCTYRASIFRDEMVRSFPTSH